MNFIRLFNPKSELDSEGLFLQTTVLENTDKSKFTNQKIVLQSYCNNASINLYSIAITPEILRKAAYELEKYFRETGVEL